MYLEDYEVTVRYKGDGSLVSEDYEELFNEERQYFWYRDRPYARVLVEGNNIKIVGLEFSPNKVLKLLEDIKLYIEKSDKWNLVEYKLK